MARFRGILNSEKSDNDYTAVIGDINIDINGRADNDYLDRMAHYGFKSFINISTKTPCYGMHSCFEHIFFRTLFSILKQIEAGVIQTEITDNFSTIIAIPKSISENIDYPQSFNSKNFCLVNIKLMLMNVLIFFMVKFLMLLRKLVYSKK